MEPVKKSEAPDYYEIIRFPIGQLFSFLDSIGFLPVYDVTLHSVTGINCLSFAPTDLKTMTERLKNRYYVTKKLFIADLQRIITNCREYNLPDSEYCKCANTLEKFFYFKLKDGGLIEKWTNATELFNRRGASFTSAKQPQGAHHEVIHGCGLIWVNEKVCTWLTDFTREVLDWNTQNRQLLGNTRASWALPNVQIALLLSLQLSPYFLFQFLQVVKILHIHVTSVPKLIGPSYNNTTPVTTTYSMTDPVLLHEITLVHSS